MTPPSPPSPQTPPQLKHAEALKPSRPLRDLLQNPTTNTPEHLLTIALDAMASLKLTYTATEEVHAHAHVRFLKAVKTLDEMASRPRGWGCMIVDEGVAMAVVQREYEGAMGELEGRRRELELCEREREGLRGDVSLLALFFIDHLFGLKN